MNDAADRSLFVDLTFMPLAEKIAPAIKSLRQVVVLTDHAHMPQTSLPNAVAYEEWLAEADGDFTWKNLDENAACGMCYTSGTTGHPKGVVYSHRSNVLHAMMAAMPDAMGICARDVVLPVVPMFHANAWGLAQSCPMVGAKMVMPGGKMDGASIYELLDTEKVTFSAAVPTVWLMLLQHLEETGKTLPHLKRWHERYAAQGLVIVGVHTPEFSFEREMANLQAAIRRHAIPYPVAQDNAYRTWTAWRNQSWPTLYLVDRDGRVVFKHVGEGDSEAIELEIVRVLAR